MLDAIAEYATVTACPWITGVVSVSSTVDPLTTAAVTVFETPPEVTVNRLGTAVFALRVSL